MRRRWGKQRHAGGGQRRDRWRHRRWRWHGQRRQHRRGAPAQRRLRPAMRAGQPGGQPAQRLAGDREELDPRLLRRGLPVARGRAVDRRLGPALQRQRCRDRAGQLLRRPALAGDHRQRQTQGPVQLHDEHPRVERAVARRRRARLRDRMADEVGDTAARPARRVRRTGQRRRPRWRAPRRHPGERRRRGRRCQRRGGRQDPQRRAVPRHRRREPPLRADRQFRREPRPHAGRRQRHQDAGADPAGADRGRWRQGRLPGLQRPHPSGGSAADRRDAGLPRPGGVRPDRRPPLQRRRLPVHRQRAGLHDRGQRGDLRQDLRAPALQQPPQRGNQQRGFEDAVLRPVLPDDGGRPLQLAAAAAGAEPAACVRAGAVGHLLGQRGADQQPARRRRGGGAGGRHHLRQALRLHGQGQLRLQLLPDRIRRRQQQGLRRLRGRLRARGQRRHRREGLRGGGRLRARAG